MMSTSGKADVMSVIVFTSISIASTLSQYGVYQDWPRVLTILIDTKSMTDIISTVPDVHTILTESTHNIDRYKDYDTQFINCT